MKIERVRARVYEWNGEVVPARSHTCTNAMDILGDTGDSMGSFRFHGWTVVEVESDDGLIGIGNVALAPRIAKDIVNQYLAPQLIGADPFDYEYLWQKMYRSTLAWGRKGIGMAAISGVDIAIWDLMGKATVKPVFKLLGGRTKKRIRCYASKLYNNTIDEMQKEARQYIDLGFSAFKMRAGYGPADGPEGMKRNVDAVAAVREVVGDEADLMLDCYMALTVPYAIRLAKELEPYNLKWIEEALHPDDYDGYAQVRSSIWSFLCLNNDCSLCHSSSAPLRLVASW